MSSVWDPVKAQANFRKHGVRFSDAEGVLLDPSAITVEDPAEQEQRFISIGLDVVGRVVVVVYTYRGEAVRLISARLATQNERQEYEKGIRLHQRQARSGDSPTGKDAHHDSHRR